MEYIFRTLESRLAHHLKRGKSVLLLGPRQTGKSTLLGKTKADLSISFIVPQLRLRYERDPSALVGELELLKSRRHTKRPLVIVDEVQKVPLMLDGIQDLIDRGVAQFILTGSSARKLRRGSSVNLLPGRVVVMRLDPFVYQELKQGSLESFLLYGSLPGISAQKSPSDRDVDLESYVETYLEEEVRSEALVRDVGLFSRFLEYAGLESGKIVNFNALSQELGVSSKTVAAYFEILVDCLVAERIEPIVHSKTRKKLTKSNRYLLFDMGVRRLCAREGDRLSSTRLGELFEQYVGLELVRYARLSLAKARVRYWRDADGPEVDWVVEKEGAYIPIEVKWTESPTFRDAKHLDVFLREYPQATRGYVVCRVPRPLRLSEQVIALPWQNLDEVI